MYYFLLCFCFFQVFFVHDLDGRNLFGIHTGDFETFGESPLTQKFASGVFPNSLAFVLVGEALFDNR